MIVFCRRGGDIYAESNFYEETEKNERWYASYNILKNYFEDSFYLFFKSILPFLCLKKVLK